MGRRIAAACLSTAAFSGPALAAAQDGGGAGASVPTGLGAGYLVQLTLALALVVAAIVVAAWLLRRVTRLQSSAGGALQVLGGLSMGPRERVVLIQVGETQLLLGVAPGRVQTLHVLENPIGGVSAPRGADRRFSERLKAVLQREQES